MSEARNPVATSPWAPGASVVLPPEELTARWPVLVMVWAGAKWLVVAALLGFLTSLKLHAPNLLADAAWATYGRLQPAFWMVLVYGFALQTGWGLGLWLLTRMGRTALVLSPVAVTGACFWNLGLVVALIGVLAGHGTGYPWLEAPGYATCVLLLGCALISVSLLLTFRARRTAELTPSQWFLLAAVFWFPWVYSSAQLLLVARPVRGIMQAVVAWWYGAQLMWLCFVFLGLALLWEVIPRLVGRSLYSRYLALFVFWLLVLFAGWRGIPNSAPLPAWMPSVSAVFAVFSVVPLIALALNFHRTLAGDYRRMCGDPVRLLALAGVLACVAFLALGILQSLPSMAHVTDLTLLGPGVQAVGILGLLGCTFMAVSYELVPGLLPGAFVSRTLGKLQVAAWILGLLLHALPLVVGGIVQGTALNHADRNFMEAFRPALMALRLSTMGDLLLLVSAVLYAVNFGRGWISSARAYLGPWMADALRIEPVEVSR